jgi:hypothetical protein
MRATASESASAEQTTPSPSAAGARRAVCAAFLLALAACGGGGGGADAPPPPPADPGVSGAPYFTYSVGDRWRRVQSDGVVVTTRVLRDDAVGLLLREEGSDGAVDELLFTRTDTSFGFVPPATADAVSLALGRYDIARFPLRVGSRFTALDRTLTGLFDFDGDGRADDLRARIEVTVVGFERVSVPAGTFDNALRQRTVITQTVSFGGSTRTQTFTGTSDDWYAPGVGPVRSVFVTEFGGVRETSEDLLQDYRVGTLSNDTVAPAVASRSPADGSLSSNADIVLRLSEAIERSSVTASTLQVRDSSDRAVPGTTELRDERTLAFVPSGPAAFADGRYTVSLGTAPEDWAGNRLATPLSWTFQLDRSGPVLVARTPETGASNLDANVTVSFTFDEAPDPTSVPTSGAFFVCDPGTMVPAVVRLEGRTVTMTPSVPLGRGWRCSVSPGSGLRDALGNFSSGSLATEFSTSPGRFALPVIVPALADFRVAQLHQADLDGDGRNEVLAVAQPPEGGFSAQTLVLRRTAGGGLASVGEALAGFSCAGSVLAADMDRDGRPDVVSSAPFCGLQWARQRSDGSFAVPVTVDAQAQAGAKPIELAGSSRPGLVYLTGSTANVLRLVAPASAGGFGPPQTLYSSGDSTMDVPVVVDIDGDGRADVVTTTAIAGNTNLVVARQRPDAGFDISTRLIPGLSLLTAADLTNDGRVDLVFRDASGVGRLMILPQLASGGFPDDGDSLVLPGNALGTAQVGDIDGDGRPDFTVAITSSCCAVANFVTVAYRSGGGFQQTPLIEYGPEAARLVPQSVLLIADFNGDGRTDLLHGNTLIAGRTAVAAPARANGSAARRLGAGLMPTALPGAGSR